MANGVLATNLPRIYANKLSSQAYNDLKKLVSLQDENGNFPEGELAIPATEEDELGVVAQDTQERRNEIIRRHPRFRSCKENNHDFDITYDKKKVVCFTCQKEIFGHILKWYKQANRVRQETRIITVPVPMLDIPRLVIDNVLYDYDASDVLEERRLIGSFGNTCFKEYLHLPSKKSILCKKMPFSQNPTDQIALENELNCRNMLTNLPYVANFYGAMGGTLSENLIYMECMNISLEELYNYQIEKSGYARIEIVAEAVHVVLNLLKDSPYILYFPIFDLKPSSFGVNWNGEIKLCNFENISSIPVLTKDGKFWGLEEKFNKNIITWRLKMLKNLAAFITLFPTKDNGKIKKFIDRCHKSEGDLKWIKDTTLCKNHPSSENQKVIQKLFDEYTGSFEYLSKQIPDEMTRFLTVNNSNNIICCNQLIQSFFTLYSENKPAQMHPKETQLVQSLNLSASMAPTFENKLDQYLEFLIDEIYLASDDEINTLELLQKCSGSKFCLKLFSKFPNIFPNIERLNEKFKKVENALNSFLKNIYLVDSELIPEIIKEYYRDEHFWYFGPKMT